MTGPEFSGVDIDLLADYVGGALDGTPDEAVVTALIADDVAWREAHAQLSGGVTAVTGQLQALGSMPEPMPADVLARLDAALLGATADRSTSLDAPVAGASAAPAAMEPGSDGAAPERHLVAVVSRSRGGRARRLRWAAPIGIAAGVAAFIGFGFQQFTTADSEDATTSAAGAAADAPQVLPGTELGLPNASPQILQTGTDYRRATLGTADDDTSTMIAPEAPTESATTDRKAAPDANTLAEADPALDRLRVQEALRACLDAIAAQAGVPEITPQTIDFARYNGSPAVIVQFTAAGQSWAWAAGPACGTTGVGADTRDSVRVG